MAQNPRPVGEFAPPLGHTLEILKTDEPSKSDDIRSYKTFIRSHYSDYNSTQWNICTGEVKEIIISYIDHCRPMWLSWLKELGDS